MAAINRGKVIVVLGALLGVSLAGSGCQITVDTGRSSRQSCPHCAGLSASTGNAHGAAKSTSPAVTQASHAQSGTPDVAPLPRVVPAPEGMPNGMPLAPPLTVPSGDHPEGLPVEGAHGDPGPLPVELVQVSHPPYTIAPPDILVIDAVRLIPRPPYRLDPGEVLLIQVTNTLPTEPISGPYIVSPDGTINLGFAYGAVRVAGLTLNQAQAAIRNHLGTIIRNPQVVVALAQFRAMQQVRGEHLVRQDGTISLGTYGCVYVAGLTLGQARAVIEQHLSQHLLNPEISVDIGAYNSKVYYVILDGGGFGQQLFRFPITGNETVLDAIANVQGLPPVASKRRIWVARPAPPGYACSQILPVDWNAITQAGRTETNYQLFPGDRIFVKADKLIAFDNWLSKLFAPIERVLGITLLGQTTVQSFRNNGTTGGLGLIVP